MNDLYLLMQINDSTFPIGAYTQSYGLETYILDNKILNKDDALKYVSTNLETTFLYTDLLSVSLAYDYGKALDIQQLSQLDKTLLALKSPREIREASIKLGNRFIKSVLTMIDGQTIFNNYINNSDVINYSTAYGVFCSTLNIDKKTVLSFFLYSQTSAMVTNCVKTIPLSQTHGQEILYELSKKYDTIISRVQTLDQDYLGLSMPAFDIRCMQHEILYSRLYMS